MNNQIFQTLKELPIPLSQAQCVLHKQTPHFLSEYPSDAELVGHCVVKLVDNNNNKDTNQITLLSFGGNKDSRHTLIMKYVTSFGRFMYVRKCKNNNKKVTEVELYRQFDGDKEIIKQYLKVNVYNLKYYVTLFHNIKKTNKKYSMIPIWTKIHIVQFIFSLLDMQIN
ncbi:hypothetical protein RFI_32781 [Reticulomyxa filosa]|uniref:Uncharacterized protein n=1 Tax=Reticulomyxa filosa TaxID=46433 RepID=X6LRU8_RETFI|nr:hypothetical protein RFI_32781 [Reticulomyxa filosa]|eukprot:ETO04618.1 hypothetical protein RFI_32781 [Reticulomyxa filosa]